MGRYCLEAPRRNGFRHPNLLHGDWKFEVTPTIRHPRNGPALPFLKVTLPSAASDGLLAISDDQRLFWSILDRETPHLFGVYVEPSSPWLVTLLDGRLSDWARHALACKLWVLDAPRTKAPR